MLIENGANEFTLEDIEAFLNEERTATPAVIEEKTPPATQPTEPNKEESIEKTQAFANRLKDATTKARNEERENIAKELGHASFKEMQEANMAKLLKDKGLDPDEVAPMIEELLQKRLAEDPRLKELEEFRQKKIEEWAVKELVELKNLTKGKISKMEDVPKNVIELWKKKGSLKAAFLELEGEKLIREIQTSIASEQSKSSTNHLNSPQGLPPVDLNADKRPLTQKEKDIYKLFNPSATEDKLNKMLKDKN